MALTVLLLAVLASLAIVPPLLDWSRYRNDFAVFLTDVLGVEVRIEGDVSLRLLPTPGMSVREVSIGSFARADSLALEGDWFALLTGSLQARIAEASGVEVVVERNSEEGWRLPIDALPFEILDIFGGTVSIRDDVLGADEEFALTSARIESGRVSVLLATPNSPLGESLDLRLSHSGAEFSLQARTEGSELRLSGTGVLNAEPLVLEAILDARFDSEISGEDVHLRTQVNIEEDTAKFSEISVQWGASHWRGSGQIDSLATDPMLKASLHSGIFDVSRGKELLEALAGMHNKTGAWARGMVELKASSVSWQSESLGEGALAIYLDSGGKPELNIALESLPGGGFARWQGRAEQDPETLSGTFTGMLDFSVEHPEYITLVPFLGDLNKPLRLKAMTSGSLQNIRLENLELEYGASRLQGRIVYDPFESVLWDAELRAGSLNISKVKELTDLMETEDPLKESRIVLFVEDLLADSTQLGSLSTQVSLLHNGVSLESLRLDGEASGGLRVEASGGIFWSQKPEGSLDARLLAPSGRARDALAAMLVALDIREGDWLKGVDPLSLRGEWTFALQQPDILKLSGDVGDASVRIEAENVFDVFYAEEPGQSQAPLQASWQRQGDSILLEGLLDPFPNFFRGTLEAKGFESEFPLALRADISATSDNQGRRVFWEKLQLGETDDSLRGSGWIAEVVSSDSWRFQADIDAGNIETVPTSQWHALALLGEMFSRNFGGIGVGSVKARGNLFGGEAGVDMEVPADMTRTRWRATLEDSDIEQASAWLWDEALVRGRFSVFLEATGSPLNIDMLAGSGNAQFTDFAVCCIDIEGLRAQAGEGVAVISAFAAPRLERNIWTQPGSADFILALQDGILEQRALGSPEGISNVFGQLDLEAMSLEMQADFLVAVGSNGEIAPLTYRIEGDAFAPAISFDSIALEQALEGSRLGQILEELETPQ